MLQCKKASPTSEKCLQLCQSLESIAIQRCSKLNTKQRKFTKRKSNCHTSLDIEEMLKKWHRQAKVHCVSERQVPKEDQNERSQADDDQSASLKKQLDSLSGNVPPEHQ